MRRGGPRGPRSNRPALRSISYNRNPAKRWERDVPEEGLLDPVLAVTGQTESRDMCLLMRSSFYVIAASIGTSTKEMTPYKTVVDTGSGYNVIRHDALPTHWRDSLIKGETGPALGDANGNPLPVRHVVKLTIRIGNANYTAAFSVVDKLAVPVLVGTQFLDRHCDAIWCRKRKLQLTRATVPILGLGNASQPYNEHESERDTRKRWKSDNRQAGDVARTLTQIKLSRALQLPPYSQCRARVVSRMDGLIITEPKSSLHDRYRIRVANGVHEVQQDVPFDVLVSNFGPTARTLPKGTTVAYATRSPLALVTVEGPTAKKLCAVLNLPTDADVGPTTDQSGKENGPQRPEEEQALEDQPIRVEEGPPCWEGSPPKEGEPSKKLDAGIGEDWRNAIDLSELKDQGMKDKVFAMFEKHVAMWSGTLGTIRATEHRIEVQPGTRPIRQPPYRAGHKSRETVAEHIQTQLDAGVIEPAQSEWASPVVLVLKKDGTIRFCVDFRRLNAATIADTYPLPRMEDCIDSLGDATVFSTLDALWGYWQVPIAEEDRDKTTFTTHLGTYRFKRMPFGLRNAPATFQRALDIVLSGVRWRTCLVYLDDVVVFSKTETDHLDHLDEVLTLLEEAGIKLKLKKCFFFRSKIEYLGHILMPGRMGVSPDSKASIAVKNARFPVNLTQMRSFLGAANVYRRFIKGFSKLARPLTDMLTKDSTANFTEPTEEQTEAFDALKGAMIRPPILALPKPGRPYMIDTDASSYALGAALLQQQDPANPTEWATVGYYSRVLSKEERNYSPTERECLAVVWAATMLRPYVEGSHFQIRTDHNALRWMMTLNDPQGRLMRWRLRLMEFDYEVVYRPGRVHQVPDALSRLPSDPQQEPEPIDDDIPTFEDAQPAYSSVMAVTRSAQKKDGPRQDKSPPEPISARTTDAQGPKTATTPRKTQQWDGGNFAPLPGEDAKDDEEDVFVDVRGYEANNMGVPIAARTGDDTVPSPITTAEILAEQRHDDFCQTVAATSLGRIDSPFFEDDQGVLCRTDPRERNLVQVVLPTSLQPRALRLAHYSPLAGHPGQSRMHARLRRSFWWPHMAADVTTTVRNCTACAKNRLRLMKKTGLLKLFPALKPLDSVAIDQLGPLPEGTGGSQFLLCIVDRFTKLTQVVPLKTATAYTVAAAFVEHWVYKYGPPQTLVSDNGPQFSARFFQRVCRIIGVNNAFTTAYHPQANGQVERFNRSMAAMLRCYVEDHPSDWPKYVNALCYAYNTSVHRTTGTTPFDLVLSRVPPDFATTHRAGPKGPSEAAARDDYIQRLEQALSKAKASLQRTQARYKRNFDARLRRRRAITPEDAVYLDVHDGAGKRPKLQHETEGPFRVLKVSQRTATIQRGKAVEVVSLDRVTPAPRHLRPAPQPGEATPEDVANKSQEGEVWVFDRLLDHRRGPEGTPEFLVKWSGPWAPDWQPRDLIPEEAIAQYFASRRNAEAKPPANGQ